MTEQLERILERDAERSVQESRQTALNAARTDAEQDEREDQIIVEQGPVGPDIEMGEVEASAVARSRFNDMAQDAAKKATLLSKTVISQEFGKLEVDDQNEYEAGVAGNYSGGDVQQNFGDVKIGSQNKIRQGVFRSM